MDRPGAARRVAALAVAALLTATLAACGSSGSPTTSGSSSTAPNKEAMRAGLVQASDFPPGWQDAGTQKDSKDDDDAATKRMAKSIPDCAEFVEQSDIEDKQTSVESHKFENAAEAAVNPKQASYGRNDVAAFASAAEAKTAYDGFAGASTTSCFQQLFDQMLEKESAANATPGEPTATYTTTVELLDVPAAGDETTAYLVVVTIQAGAAQRQLGFVMQLVRIDQYLVDYSATLFQPVPDGFGANLVAGSIGRLEAALAKV